MENAKAWRGPFNDFPRELGFPQRSCLVYTQKEFLDKINRSNGKSTCFTSLYAFEKIKEDGRPDYDSAKVTHIFFDLDNGNAMLNAQKLHKFLEEQNFKHTMNYSGGGFHVFLATQYPNFLKDKKSAIYNAIVDISEKVGMKIGIDEHSDIDSHSLGNLAQLVRVPNTWNFKRRRFCTPITAVQLGNYDELLYTASHQNNWITIYGEKYLDLSQYDRERIERAKPVELELEESTGVELDFEKFPPCIKSLLTANLIKHRCRYLIITYCKELGLSLSDTVQLLKKYLPSRTFHHCVSEERQPLFIYRRGDLVFPNCETLRAEGYCSTECGKR